MFGRYRSLFYRSVKDNGNQGPKIAKQEELIEAVQGPVDLYQPGSTIDDCQRNLFVIDGSVPAAGGDQKYHGIDGNQTAGQPPGTLHMGQVNDHPQYEKGQKDIAQIGHGIGNQRRCQGAGQGEYQIACDADCNKEKEQQ